MATLSPASAGRNPSPERPRRRRGAVNLVKCSAPPGKAGTNAGYRSGCRCPGCTDGARAAALRRRQLIAFGRWDPFVDAGPVRAHVEALRASGMGPKTIAAEAGVAYTVVIRLLYAVGGSPRSQRVRKGNAAALLACRLRPAAGALVDGTGTRRRLEALMWLGWSKWALARELGCQSERVLQLMRRPRVTAGAAADVRDLFERLWMSGPVVSDRWVASSVSRTRRFARAAGFLPPLAWDEESIDDPAAQPAVGVVVDSADGEAPVDEVAVERIMTGALVVPKGTVSPELVEAVRRLCARGLTDREIGRWVGRRPESVQKLRERYGVGSGVQSPQHLAAAS